MPEAVVTEGEQPKRRGGWKPTGRVRMVFAVDADLAERLRQMSRPSALVNRLIRDDFVTGGPERVGG